MPIDPSIIAGIKSPVLIDPVKAQTAAVELGNAKLETQANQLKLRELQQKSQDALALRSVMQQAQGDPVQASKILKTLGRFDAAVALDKQIRDNATAKADAKKKQLDAAIEQHKFVSQVMQGATNPDSYALLRKMVAGALGDDAASDLPEQYDPNVLKSIIESGRTAGEQLQAARDKINAETAAAELPGKIAESEAKQQVTANMEGGLTRDQRADNANQARQREQEQKRIDLEAQRVGLERKRLSQDSAPLHEVKPGTPEFRIAQDLAYGRMTFAQFRTLAAYNRNIGQKFAIYDKASQLNPDFNPAAFEIGLSFAKSPQTQRQLAALDNVVSGVPDLLAASDAAKRSGVPVLNKYLTPVKIGIGDKRFSNFRTAQLAFADELSGGLGFGTATDMKLQLGIDLTDPNLSPDAFRSAVEKVVVPFVERKRASLLKQEGIYGQPGASPGSGAVGPKEGETKPIPGYPGTEQTYRGGKWIRTK